MGKKLDFAIAILNGTIGDHLCRSNNDLAIDFTFARRGESLTVDEVARSIPAGAKVVLLVHGLMNSEAIFEDASGEDFGTRLAKDLGFVPVYVRYNSGRSIPDNGALLDAHLEALFTKAAPIDELVLLGYSMGGLVVRSACHFAKEAGHAWLGKVRRALYVGTPHRGAPLERGGRVVSSILAAIPDPTTNLVGQIADLRSAGLQDLGDAELRHEDRARRGKTWKLTDAEHPVPLLPSIEHFLVAGGVSNAPWVHALFGDSIVPLGSAKNESKTAIFPLDHVKFVPGTAHIDLPTSPRVYELLRVFLEGSK